MLFPSRLPDYGRAAAARALPLSPSDGSAIAALMYASLTCVFDKTPLPAKAIRTFARSPLDAIVIVRSIKASVARGLLGWISRWEIKEIRTLAASPLDANPFDVSTTRSVTGLLPWPYGIAEMSTFAMSPLDCTVDTARK